MKPRILTLTAAAAATLFTTGAVSAQEVTERAGQEVERAEAGAATAVQATRRGMTRMSAKDIVGNDLLGPNPDGSEELIKVGALSDLIVDPTSGETKFVLLDRADTATGASKTYVLPVSSVQPSWNAEEEALRLESALDDAAFEGAPEFDAEAFNGPDTAWASTVVAHYSGGATRGDSPRTREAGADGAGAEAQEASVRTPEFVRLSNVVGSAIINAEEAPIGKIDHIIVSPKDMKIAFAVLSVSDSLGIGDDHRAIPMGVVSCQVNERGVLRMTSGLDADSLAAAPIFDADDMERMTSDEFGESIQAFGKRLGGTTTR